MARARIALLSNPRSTGNVAQLPRVRAYCVEHPDIFHYEVERVEQIGEALKTIARVKPAMLVINGGDGTVQAALTELHNGGHFGETTPPVAVLPSGKTNLIALDLGVHGDPVAALGRLVAMAQGDIAPHLVPREMIALRHGDADGRPVIGMFLGGAGLADTMLYCRHKIYPLGLPNSVSHLLAALATLVRQMFGLKMSFLPPPPAPISVSVRRDGKLTGRFALILVTTLERLLLTSHLQGRPGGLKLIAVEQRPFLLIRAFAASVRGKLDRYKVQGIHFEGSEEISIEGDASDVILDGETFRAEIGKPIMLRATLPLSFVRLAA